METKRMNLRQAAEQVAKARHPDQWVVSVGAWDVTRQFCPVEMSGGQVLVSAKEARDWRAMNSPKCDTCGREVEDDGAGEWRHVVNRCYGCDETRTYASVGGSESVEEGGKVTAPYVDELVRCPVDPVHHHAGRQAPIYAPDRVATGRFRCEVCGTVYGPSCDECGAPVRSAPGDVWTHLTPAGAYFRCRTNNGATCAHVGGSTVVPLPGAPKCSESVEEVCDHCGETVVPFIDNEADGPVWAHHEEGTMQWTFFCGHDTMAMAEVNGTIFV